MKTIIAGSRAISGSAGKFPVRSAVERACERFGVEVSEVVCGMCPGVDMLGKEWADSHGILVKEFPASWEKHGKRAGFVRNKQMAEYCRREDPQGGMLVAIWDGTSKGTKSMISLAEEMDLKISILLVGEGKTSFMSMEQIKFEEVSENQEGTTVTS